MRSGDGYHRISFRKEVQGSRMETLLVDQWLEFLSPSNFTNPV